VLLRLLPVLEGNSSEEAQKSVLQVGHEKTTTMLDSTSVQSRAEGGLFPITYLILII
jgi:hypothetical protein